MGAPAQANGLKSWKQVGQDLGNQPTDTRGQILNWQTTAQDSSLETIKSPSKANLAKSADDKKEDGNKKAANTVVKDAAVPRLVTARPSPAKLNKDVKDATTPKKRVVSDEHWRQTRKAAASPQSAPQAARQVIPEGATHGFYKTTGSPNYDAWVRKRRKSPPRTPKETVPLDLKPEETDPLNLLYWMTGKQKADFKPLPPRPQAASPPRYEIKYSTKEAQPTVPARTVEEPRRQQVTTRKSQDLPVSRKSSPVSRSTNVEVKPQGRSGNRIESWLGNFSDPFGHDSDSSQEDFSPSGMFAKYPTLRKRAGPPPKARHQRNDHSKDDRREERAGPAEEEDYFSKSRMPRHRLDEHADFESEVTSPLSPGSLQRRGAKRHGKAPRKRTTTPPSPVIDRSSDLTESILSEGEAATIYSTIENDRHGPIKYVKRHAPVVVDIPSRRVTSDSFQDVSPPADEARVKVPEGRSRPVLTDTSNGRPTFARKITTEADLMSVLSVSNQDHQSLPRARTLQVPVNIQEILADLRADEEHYVDELKTLVDGVIPVLLSSVLSKNDSKDMAGVFSSSPAVPAATNAIVNIGVALERLKGCHHRLPTTNVIALLLWAETTSQVYEDYLKAWRLGFQDVVVHLAPTSQGQRSTSTSTVTPGSGKEQGKQVNVAYLLKRPLVRLKYLTRSIKAIGQAEDSKLAASCVIIYQNLLSLAKRRQDEERARLEDDAAATIDSTRARDPRTLASTIGVKIDPGRCVRARDFFTLQMQHSSGQCVDCSVEIILRDDKSIPETGDVLICEVGSGSKWLLFPPIQLAKTSARLGIDLEELVVMIRGTQAGREEWHELLVLRAPDEHTVRDWHRMLGSTPMPPAVHQPTMESQDRVTVFAETLSNLSLDEIDVPLGERSIVSSFVNRHEREFDGDTIRPLQGASQRPLPVPPGISDGRASPRIVKARSVETMSGVAYGSAPIASAAQSTIKRKAVPPRSPTASSVSMPTTPTHPEQRRQGSTLSSIAKPIYTPSSPTKGPLRSSSPLKHEFKPDHSSATASDFDDDFSDDDASFTSESSVDDFPLSPLEHWKPRNSATLSQTYSSSVSGSLAPSDSASQIPQGQQPAQSEKLEKTFASVMYWSPQGHWAPIGRDECLIIVSPGLIEAFDIASSHNWSVGDVSPGKAGIRPIVALELTPLVPLRRGTALDISVRSPPTGESRFQDASNIMFRSRNGQECAVLYGLINQARINNPTYIAMQTGRPPVGGGNWSSYMDRRPGARNISSWWRFGSKKSGYRKGDTERTPSLGQRTEDSGASLTSAMSALKRFSNGRNFSLGKSTITSGAGLSKSSSSVETISEGAKSPPINMTRGTPTGITNKRIRLYQRESAAKWRDMGSARLTILHPSQAAVIAPTGHLIQEKRVLITSKSGNHTLLDVTLGETSFERVARTGLAVSVVEDLVGSNGMRVDVASMGGVGGSKVRVCMIQMKTEAETAHTFSLVGRLRY